MRRKYNHQTRGSGINDGAHKIDIGIGVIKMKTKT